MNDQFYRLAKPDTLRGRAEWNETEIEMETVYCPVDGSQRAGKRTSDLSVLLTRKTINDFVWTWHGECLVQDRVLNIFREECLTGYEVRPVAAQMKIKSKVPDPCDDNHGLSEQDAAAVQIPVLWELVVTGWGGMASAESGISLNKHCPACHHSHYTEATDLSRIFDREQWDGSDFFMIWPLPRFRFITEKAAKLLKKHKLKGFKIEPIDSLSIRQLGGYSPGRLRYYMPDERAHELGDPLGIY